MIHTLKQNVYNDFKKRYIKYIRKMNRIKKIKTFSEIK